MNRMALALVLVVGLTGAMSPALAQYKWKDAQGKWVFSDQPPPDPAVAVSGAAPRAGTAAASREGGAQLPYSLRSTVQRRPVTLYTTSGCKPCNDARAHLSRRGVPFTEKSVVSAQDAKAFEQQGFSSAGFPAMKVGGERAEGYESGTFDRILDVAGYPKSSVLPRNWKQAPATSLAERPAQPAPVPTSAESGGGQDDGAAQDTGPISRTPVRQSQTPSVRF